jgi:hypothetical protein
VAYRFRGTKRSVPRFIAHIRPFRGVAFAAAGRCSFRTANGRREASMLGSLESLSEDGPVRQLLTLYRRMKETTPADEWHDRLGEMPGVERADLSRHYGLLLANGWLETRIDRDSLGAGGVKQAYQITKDGLRALQRTEDRFGNIAFAPPEEEFSLSEDFN